MKLDWIDGVFVFECTYEERALPKNAKFWWDAKRRSWITQSPRCAMQLRQYATQTARARFVDRCAAPSLFYQEPHESKRWMKRKRA